MSATEYAAQSMECPACGKNRPEMQGARFCPGCGGELPEDGPDPMIGAVVGGRFRIVSLIAEGGMGRVYAAEQRMGTILRKVAIKTLLSEFAASESQVQRFLLECSMVSELEHPNTIKFYDWGQTDAGGLFIAMEFLSGESLAHVVHRDGGLSPERADVIFGQICGSLQEAHDKGIVHRDVKSENVLLTNPAGEADFVKVLDFGIAKRLESDGPKLTPLGLVLGSPAYMSPEQFTHGDHDHRSDIYSLGIVAFESLTAQLPFSATELAEWPLLHRHADPMSFEAAGVFVPESMRRAVMRALSKYPEDRQSSMREFYSEFTLGTPRRSSFARARVAPDEAVTLMKPSNSSALAPHHQSVGHAPSPLRGSSVGNAPSPLRGSSVGNAPSPLRGSSTAPYGSPDPGADGPPPTHSSPPRYEESSSHLDPSMRESSAIPPPFVVPPPPKIPSSMLPPAERSNAASKPERSRAPLTAPMSRIPETEREAVPPTVREMPRRRWPLLLAGIVLAIAIGAGIAVMVVPRPREFDDPPQPTGTVPPPKPSVSVAPENAPEGRP